MLIKIFAFSALPFHVMKNPFLRYLLRRAFQPRVLIVPSVSTLMRRTHAAGDASVEAVKARLQVSPARV